MYLSDWIEVCKWVLDIPALLVVAVFVQVDFFFLCGVWHVTRIYLYPRTTLYALSWKFGSIYLIDIICRIRCY